MLVEFNGRRRNLTLGRMPKSDINHFSHNVHRLLEHVRHGGKTLPPDLLAWISQLNATHMRQLGELELFDYRRVGMTVGELLDAYQRDYNRRTDVMPSTKKRIGQTIENRSSRLRKHALDVLEPVKKSILPGAEPIWSDESLRILTDFNSWQRNHYAQSTWTRDNKLFSSIGLWAVKRGICSHNPFSKLPTASMVNEERNHTITIEMALDAMEACQSPDIRLTIAMGRFAGMRTCSEVRTMKWEHVKVDENRLIIIDSKKRTPREMPLFETVAQELERQRAITGHTRFVASEEMRSTSSAANYTRIKEAVIRSGQTPWERLRHNLRASCENDWLAVFDERLVTAWIGHTVQVSRDHYQKARPEDFRQAIAAFSAVSTDLPKS